MDLCPVCGWRYDPPLMRYLVDGWICPCCSTEYGYSDRVYTYAELRATWIANGAQWWSDDERPPPGWNAITQLQQAGLTSPHKAV